jgi:hypothetical protein
MYQFPLQTLLMFSGGIGGARCCQATVKLLLDQSRLFQQSDHLGPDDLIQELLSDEATVIANWTTQFSPAIGANALVVVKLGLVGDRLQLSTECLFALAQRRHAPPQLFDRQESFLCRELKTASSAE